VRTVLLSLRKDLLRWVRSPILPLVFLSFPIVFALLIGLAFGGGDEIAPIKLALVNEDDGVVSRLISSAFTSRRAPVAFQIQEADSAGGLRLVENDKVSAMLRVPAGFSDSLFSGGTSYLEVVKNPAEAVYPRIVEEYAGVLALLGTGASRILGDPLSGIQEQVESRAAPTDAFLSAVSVDIGRQARKAARYVFPPAIYLRSGETEGDDRSSSSPLKVALFVLPGMATFALLTLAIASMSDLRRERSAGTLARQLAGPVRPWNPVAAKIGVTLILGLMCIVILGILAAMWGDGKVSIAGFAVLSFAFALCATGFATLMQSLFESETAGSAFGSIVVMVMSLLGGSFIPLSVLPGFARRIAPFTLNYWANTGFHKLLFEKASPAELLPNVGILIGMGVLFVAVSLPLMRKRILRGA